MNLTSKQRAALRGAANTLDPVFQIGKGEIGPAMIGAVADCLAARELILDNSEYTAREAADLLSAGTGAACVQVIGRKFVLFLPKDKDSAYAALLAGAK